jgi:GxxExxY protein
MGLNTIDSLGVHLVTRAEQRWRRLTLMKSRATDADEMPDRVEGTLLEADLTGRIIKCFYRVYDVLGFGFLESVYLKAMLLELAAEGLVATAEAAIDVWYRDRKVGHFRADILVEGRVLVEIKASELLPVDSRKQLLNYLRASTVEVGLLLHFGPKAKFQRLIHSTANKAQQSAVR